ncbi:MAG: hypothetical protein HY270_05105 [Deltaproteobacteria bacterium]|nr:hypothetical protein [Deltaproteobacteria bacterium]
MPGKLKTIAISTVLLLLSSAEMQARSSKSDSGKSHSVVVWTGTVLTNVVYVPAKLVYAGLGGLTGAFAWALTGGNEEVADSIWTPSTGGTYVITPTMMEGGQKVHFSGS